MSHRRRSSLAEAAHNHDNEQRVTNCLPQFLLPHSPRPRCFPATLAFPLALLPPKSPPPPNSLLDRERAPALGDVVHQPLHRLAVAARVDGRRGQRQVRVRLDGDGLARVLLAHVVQHLS